MKPQSIVFSIIALLALNLPAAAQHHKATGQCGWFGIGKAAELDKDHVFWAANSRVRSSTTRARTACSTVLAYAAAPPMISHASGYCIITGGGSVPDQVFLKWSCDGDTVDCSVPWNTLAAPASINPLAPATLSKHAPPATGKAATCRVMLPGSVEPWVLDQSYCAYCSACHDSRNIAPIAIEAAS